MDDIEIPEAGIVTHDDFAKWIRRDLALRLLPDFVQAMLKAADLIVQDVSWNQIVLHCAHTPLELVNALQH